MQRHHRSHSSVILLGHLLFWSAQGHTNETHGQSAHDLIAETIGALDYEADLRTINGMRVNFKYVSRDIVEGEHSGEPYVVSIGAGTVSDDLSRGYRLIETKDAINSDVIGRELTVGIADQFSSFSSGKRVAERVSLAPPAWEMRNPFRALRLAQQAANLRREPDVVLHDSLQHVVSLNVNGVRARILLDARTKLITATETLLAIPHATSSEIAYNALGDVQERTEFMLWEIAGGLRYPTQWDTYRDDVHLLTVIIDSEPIINAAWGAGWVLAPESLQQVTQLAATDRDQIPLNATISGAPDP